MQQYFLKVREKGYKLTKARCHLINSLYINKKPQTVKEIYEMLDDKSINISSVYRNLLLFKKIGIVFEEEFKKESYFYMSDKHHHHIYCEGCDYIECIPCEHIKNSSSNFSFINHSIIFKGMCKKCSLTKK
ncbi:MAG: Fur family transcriptional regulator [Candidatus Humimicrobiaceae bacterium]